MFMRMMMIECIYGRWVALVVGLHGMGRGAWKGSVKLAVGLHGKVVLHWRLADKLDI